MKDTLPANRQVSATTAAITSGPLLPVITRLSLPLLLMYALHTGFQIIDLIWVGRLGAAATGAVSIAFYATWVLFALTEGVGVGILALVSQAVGAGNRRHAGFVAGQGVVLAAMLGVLVMVAAPWIARALFALVDAPPAVAAAGRDYLTVWLFGTPVVMVAFAVETVWRAAGDTRTPMWVMGGATVVNIILDPILIFGWGPAPALGVTGAALASVISIVVALGAFVVLARRGSELFPFDSAALRQFDAATLLHTLQIGMPRVLLGVLFACVYLFLSWLTGRLGTAAIALLGIANRIESIVYLTSDGVGLANSTVVGQNVGAGQLDRAERATWTSASVAMALALGASLLMCLAPYQALSVFTADPEVLRMGVPYLRILGISQIFMALEIVVVHGFSGAGDTLPPTLAEVPIAGLRMPLAWWAALGVGGGMNGIAWVISLTCIARGVWLALWYKRGRWRRQAANPTG